MAKQTSIAPVRRRVAAKHPSPEQVWVALARCYRTMSSVVEQSFAEESVSLTDFMLLEALLHKGAMTITEVQASALLATGSMTAAVDRLEAKGWIARTLSKKDRRARVLELTGEGRAVIRVAYARHREDLKGWMSRLSPVERAGMFGGLRKLEKQVRGGP